MAGDKMLRQVDLVKELEISRLLNPTASLILHDALLTDLSATGTSRQCVRQSPREADTQCCD
jgi:hypothetical protein